MIRFSLDPRGVRVVCLWALGLGGLLAPCFFWQGARPGWPSALGGCPPGWKAPGAA